MTAPRLTNDGKTAHYMMLSPAMWNAAQNVATSLIQTAQLCGKTFASVMNAISHTQFGQNKEDVMLAVIAQRIVSIPFLNPNRMKMN